ncbi:MAG: hypothetical protein JO366_19150 [Methylobacteriaceae bacterium]|nr:hypothetical protein [Methylobacteriaceae bacterium]MBV9246922.1 hypothetical protein [Methylobacteriaceae bacterium]MBV9635095.1 hypothetical protein [Methylobacteriaceae bacterium]MBV9705405.1 hypothetical protein [Methylobacteriaceae bacterium]
MDKHVGSVEKRALPADGSQDDPDLGEVLSRYKRSVEAKNSAVPLVGRRRKAST